MKKQAIIILFLSLLPLISAYAQNKEEKSDAPAEAVKVENPAPEIKKRWNYGTLMFDSKTFGWINEAIKSRDQQVPLEILLPNLFPVNPQSNIEDKSMSEPLKDEDTSGSVLDILQKPEPPKDAPLFYLKSILYFSRDNWSIWLNDKKISDKDNADNILPNVSIMKISRNEVIMLWKKSQIDLISPTWRRSFLPIGDNKFASPQKNIIVDTVTGDISFILKPNQTLLSSSLEIVEGAAKTALPADQKEQENTEGGGMSSQSAGTQPASKPFNKSSGINLEKNIDILKSILDYGKNLQNLDNIDQQR